MNQREDSTNSRRRDSRERLRERERRQRRRQERAQSGARSAGEKGTEAEKENFSAAMNRLESAVEELVSVTTGELGSRATNLIEDTTKRIEAELRLKKVAEEDPETEARFERKRRRQRSRHVSRRFRNRTQMSVDRDREKIAGVCAGLAQYWGVETWVVRLGAITGLIFMPQVVFPAYWITYFVMDKPSKRRSRRDRGTDADHATAQMNDEYEDLETQNMSEKATKKRRNKRSRREKRRDERPEFNARRTLRNTKVDLTQTELKLRRLESFVTSDQYELHKGLAQLDMPSKTDLGGESTR